MTNQDIKTVGQTIAAETQIGGNTAERVGGVIEGIGDALDNKDAAVGYYLATMSGSTIYINASSYRLGTGGNLRAKMPAAATTACTLTVGNAQAVQLWYNGAAVSADNSWEAGEIVTIFYDGTRFMASNSQGGGGQFGSGEKIKDILLSQVLGAGTDAITSQKGVSDAIFNEIDISSIDTLKTLNDALAPSSSLKPTYYTVTATLSSVKLKVGSMAVISDNMRHVVTEIMATHYILDDAGNLTNEHSDAEIFFIYRSVKLSGGTLPDPAGTWTKWRYVNSSAWSTVAEKISFDNSNSWIESNDVQGALDDIASIFQDGSPESDLDMEDDYGNVLVRFSGGHIKTKNFDSREIKTTVDNTESADFNVADEDGNVILSVGGGHIKTKNFDSGNIELNDYAKKKTIKYLAIGNSVNQDPACYIPYLLRKLYGDDIDFEIGVAYHGSYTIKDYVELIITGQENLTTFSYAKNTGHLTNISDVPLSYAVGYADWDIVSFEAYQADMAGSGRAEDITLAPDLLEWLKQHTKDGCRFGLITPATYTDVRDLYVGWQQDILTSCSLDFLLDYGATKEFLIAKGFSNSDLSPLENGRYIHSKEGFPCEALALTAIHFLADIAKFDDKASNLLVQITETEHNALDVPQQNGTYTSTTVENWRKCVDAALNGWRVSCASYAISNNTLRDNTFTNI